MLFYSKRRKAAAETATNAAVAHEKRIDLDDNVKHPKSSTLLGCFQMQSIFMSDRN